MDVCCACLNVKIRVVSQTDVHLDQFQKYKPKDTFFNGAVVRAQLVNVPTVRLRNWLSCRCVDDWRIKSCLLCNSDIMAYHVDHNAAHFMIQMGDEASTIRPQPSPPIPVDVIIPQSLVEKEMGEKIGSENYSQVFGVVLPELRVDDFDAQNNKESSPKSMSPVISESSLALGGPLAGSGPAQEIQWICSEFLRKEQEALDARIRAFIDTEQNQFDTLRAHVKNDRDRLLKEYQSRTWVEEGGGNLARQPSGGDESTNDSAVPLSPVSLPSVDMVTATAAEQLRAKPYPSTQSVCDGGNGFSGISAGLSGRMEDDSTNGDVFKLDLEDEYQGRGTFFAVNDEGDEDSGAGEENWDYYSHTQHTKPVKTSVKKPTQGYGLLVSKFGTSLPVTIPGRYWSPVQTTMAVKEEDDDCDSCDEEMQPQLQHLNRVPDVHVQMRALARTIQAADDPERLFGERPQRRRYKTGENKNKPTVVVPRPQTTVSAL